jgi:hypothetical protein
MTAPKTTPKAPPARPLVAAPARASTLKPAAPKPASKASTTTEEWETF